MRGFTLVELLIVTLIISVLSLIGVAAYRSVQLNARDAKRQADLLTIQSALEQYFADQFFYPTTIGGQGQPCNNVNGSLKIGCPLKDQTGNKTYLNMVPDDPLSPTVNYSYEAKPGNPIQCDNGSNKCNNYCLYAKMEKTSNTAPLGCSFPTGYNFGVTKP